MRKQHLESCFWVAARPGTPIFSIFVATEGQWLLHHECAHEYFILRNLLSSTDSVVQVSLTSIYSSSRLATAKAVSWVMVSACFLYLEIPKTVAYIVEDEVVVNCSPPTTVIKYISGWQIVVKNKCKRT